MRQADGYDAFISYSHLDDDALAATLQAGMETFARPWYRPRVLRVFRDATNLSGTSGLRSGIIAALSVSDWFLLVASEQAASSAWVSEETSWWMANRGPARFLIALASGSILWRGDDFDWESTNALPRVLAGAFAEEPAWVDLRGVNAALAMAGGAPAQPRRVSRLWARRQVGDWVADLAAPVHGMPKDSLVGAHLRYRKRTRRIVEAVVAVLVALLLTASIAAGEAVHQLGQARLQNRLATSRELAAVSENLLTTHFDIAELLAVEAYQLDPTPQALAALFQAVTASPQVVTCRQASGSVSAIAGSANGRVLVAGLTNGKVLRWALPATRPTVIASVKGAVTSVSADHDGSAIVALSASDAERWEAGTGARPLQIPAGQQPVAGGISPSGKFAAVASIPVPDPVFSFRYDVTLYSRPARVRTIAKIFTGEGYPGQIEFPSDAQLVTFDGGFGGWDKLAVPALSRIRGSVTAFGVHDYAAALSPGGAFFSYSNAGTVLPVWTTSGAPTMLPEPPLSAPAQGDSPTALAINAPGTLIAQADEDGAIRVSQITRTGHGTIQYTLPGNGFVPGGDLAFMGRSELLSASGGLLKVWDFRQYSRIAAEESIATSYYPDVAIRPDGRQAAVVSGGQDILTLAPLPPGGYSTLTAGNVSPMMAAIAGTPLWGAPVWDRDGGQMLVPALGGAQVWSPGRGLSKASIWPASRAMEKVPSSELSYPPVLTWLSPDGKRMIEVFGQGSIVVRDAVSGRISEVIPRDMSGGGGGLHSSAAVDAAGQVAAFVGDSGVSVTSLLTRRTHSLPERLANSYPGTLADVAFDGELLLVQWPDGSLQVWNADGTRLLRVIAGSAAWDGPVVSNSGLAVETRMDGSAVVIDVNSGMTLGTIALPTGPTYQEGIAGQTPVPAQTGIAMSPGGTLVTVTEGMKFNAGELIDWQMSAGAWLKVACAAAGHPLTGADWQEYVGGPLPGQFACAGTS